MTNRYVKATFSNGAILTRSSQTKTYTHAYLFEGWYILSGDWGTDKAGDKRTAGQSGFSGSEAQARKNMAAESAWLQPGQPARRSRHHGGKQTPRAVTFAEVVPVVEIDAAEYRTLNAAGHASTGNARPVTA